MNNPGESVRQNGGRQTSFHGLKIKPRWDIPGGPGVKNPPCYAEDTGWIPGQGTKIHMPWENQACMLQLLKPEQSGGHNERARAPPGKIPHITTKS